MLPRKSVHRNEIAAAIFCFQIQANPFTESLDKRWCTTVRTTYNDVHVHVSIRLLLKC